VLAIAEKWRPYRSLATSYLFSAVFEPAASSPVRTARRTRDNSKKRPEVA
jgi:3-methyladenine DNA glycosylase/8-oxoguanine DNA glycosylase